MTGVQTCALPISDIIFLQKRDRPAVELPSWVGVGENDDGFKINNYFLEHPDMVLGTPTSDSTQYGRQDYTVAPIEGASLSDQLAGAIQHLAPPDRELLELDATDEQTGEALESIPADPSVRNFSYALREGKLYFRENSRMTPVTLGKTPMERVKGMVAIRDSARRLIDLQLQNAGDDEVKAEQAKLNRLYDQFIKKYGLLNSLGNKLAFEQDSAYPLLCSLEVIDDEGKLERNGDDRPSTEEGGAPGRVAAALSVVDGGKPSIRQALRGFNTPAPVHPGMEQGQRREAAR